MACLAVTTVGDAKARVEDALAIVEDDGRRSEAEIVHLEIEQTSL